MVFGSPIFLFCFLPAAYLVYRFLPGIRSRNAWLAIASLVFYSFGQPVYLPLLLLSVVMNYLFGLLLMSPAGRGKRWPAACAVAGNLLLLGTFKYLDFFAGILNTLPGVNLPLPGLTLPIGISFFTFQGLSYALDVSREPDAGTRSFGKLVLYISFFPQLIAGPIIKYHDVALQIDQRELTPELTILGLRRFITGFAKKLLIANTMGLAADRVFALEAGALDLRLAWLGAVCYTLQIYFDFSGYSDMAIGLGRMFGFTFQENFNLPYAARSIKEFWRRWHISLSSWFRDYLYIPLGGNRKGRARTMGNKIIVFFSTGLWHGANWTFLLWGFCYFVLLYLEKYRRLGRRWITPLQRLYTLLAVNFLWVLFRADTIAGAGGYLGAMLGLTGAGTSDPLCGFLLTENLWVLLPALLFSFPLAPWLGKKLARRPNRRGPDLSLVWDLLYALALVTLGIVSACYLVKGTYNPFIYFRF